MRIAPVLRHFVLILWAIVTLFPIFWIVSTAFKTPTEWAASPPVWIPGKPTLLSFRALFAPETLPQHFREAIFGNTLSALPSIVDSLVISIGASIGALIIGSLAAYSIARFGTGGRVLAFNVLTVRMLPAIVVLIPLLIFFSGLRLLDTYRAVILVEMGVVIPFVVWLMRSFFEDIPPSVEEAAILDGSTRTGAFVRVALPLAAGGFAVTALFIFILVWTEFLVGLTLTLNNIVPLPVQLAKYQSATGGQLYGIQSALALVAIVPPTIFGLMIQKYLVTGLTFGAVKR
jgi:multiple sugar transport system permease protein